MLTQRTWRAGGGIALALSAAMAVYAATTGMLVASARHVAALFADDASMQGEGTSGFFHVCYWSFFAAMIGAALYAALLDLRFVRARYYVERREIFRRTLGDKRFRKSLQKRSSPRN